MLKRKRWSAGERSHIEAAWFAREQIVAWQLFIRENKMSRLAYPFLIVAIAGFVLLLCIHIAALLGFIQPFEQLGFVFPGIFIVFLPAIFAMNHLTRDFKRKEIWRASLRGCPKWMRRTFGAVSVYGPVGSIVLPMLYGGDLDSKPNSARAMSSLCLIFYSMAVCVLYSATRVEKVDKDRRCANGHRVSPLANFCEECGAPVFPTSGPQRVEGQIGTPTAPK